MPVKPAAYKALRQNIKAHARNLAVKHQLKKLGIDFRKAVTAKDQGKAKEIAAAFAKALDRAAQKKVIHRNLASRKKSRLAAAVKKLAA